MSNYTHVIRGQEISVSEAGFVRFREGTKTYFGRPAIERLNSRASEGNKLSIKALRHIAIDAGLVN